MHTRPPRRLRGIVLMFIVVCAGASSGADEPTAPRDVASIDAASPFIAKANKEWEAAIQTILAACK